MDSDFSAQLRTLAFGTLEDGAWGAAWFPEPDAKGALLLHLGNRSVAIEARLQQSEDGSWRIQGSGAELLVTPAAQAVEQADGHGSEGDGDDSEGDGDDSEDGGDDSEDGGDDSEDGAARAVEQPCTVKGQCLQGDSRIEIEAPGRRGEYTINASDKRLDSIREVSAWLRSGVCVSLIALRPRKQRGHEQDEVHATVIEENAAHSIVDPRLSSTYSANGRPLRVNLELSVDDPDQLPRRIAGESIGHGVTGELTGWEIQAEPLVCHYRGVDGAGMYLLARRA